MFGTPVLWSLLTQPLPTYKKEFFHDHWEGDSRDFPSLRLSNLPLGFQRNFTDLPAADENA